MRAVRSAHGHDPAEGVHVERGLLEIGGMELRQSLERPKELARHLQHRLLSLGQAVFRHASSLSGRHHGTAGFNQRRHDSG
jgi:hypothetical protein